MKKKHLLIALTVTLALAGGTEAWQIIRRARLNLVTLNVTDAPLANVLSRIARQTREQIAADRSLKGNVSLHVRNAPLRQVLGRIAEQTGAFSRLDYAIGATDFALDGLEDLLREGGDFTDAGWTNLSAVAVDFNQPPGRPDMVTGNAGGVPPGAPRPPVAIAGDNADIRVSAGPPPESGQPKRERSATGADGGVIRATLVTVGADGAPLEIDLSPERLLMETQLAASVTTPEAKQPFALIADRLAQEVGGKWRAIYTLETLPVPVGALPPGLTRFDGNSNGNETFPGDPATGGSMEAAVKQHRYDQLNRLTPEQRVREAAARKASGGRTLFKVERH